MSQADIDKLHRQLAELEGESKRQQKGEKQIAAAAVKKLAAVDKRLAEIKPMQESEEYQQLLEEKGILMQLVGHTHR